MGEPLTQWVETQPAANPVLHEIRRPAPDFALRVLGIAKAPEPAPSAAVNGEERSQALDRRDILPRGQFLRQLTREKRRADRFGSPLAIVLFELDSRDIVDVEALVELVENNNRETDIVGDLGGSTISVLLPDTNAAGATRFVQKIDGRANGLRFRAESATYPDDIFETLVSKAPKAGIAPLLLVDAAEKPARWQRRVKRVVDFLGAGVALLVLSPVMIGAAIAIKATSPGPVVFRQARVGKGGEQFVFYKFRSMHANADDRVHREYVASLIQGDSGANGKEDVAKPWSKLSTDSRITAIGRLLRNTSIDELPQLFNVLKGDLSLVGPRPPLPYEVEKYQPWHLRRILETKPGISGLWQVESRGQATFDEMVRMDLRYVQKWSLMLDFKILFKTVQVVIQRTGAS